MNCDPSEKRPENSPRGRGIAESCADMSAHPESPRLAAGAIDDPERAAEALLAWDELSKSDRQRLAEHPLQGPRFARLTAADRWLAQREPRDGWSTVIPDEPCPDANELYDFGRGPGYTAQDAARRAEIQAHLENCADCVGLVATLATPPPLPLSFEREGPSVSATLPPLDAVAPAPRVARVAEEPAGPASPLRALPPDRSTAPPRRHRAWPRFAVAAAVVLTAATLWYGETSRTSPFPAAPLLRGNAAGALAYPRGRVLAPTAIPSWASVGRRLVFEIAERPGATQYRVELSRHQGGAFETGEIVRTLVSDGPTVELEPLDLAPGHYTWRAWALVQGLDERIGDRDFEIVADAATVSAIDELAGDAEPGRSHAAVRRLWADGFYADAREIARALPPSADRDEFLRRTLGR